MADAHRPLWQGLTNRQMPRAISLVESGMNSKEIGEFFRCREDWILAHVPGVKPEPMPEPEEDKPEEDKPKKVAKPKKPRGSTNG